MLVQFVFVSRPCSEGCFLRNLRFSSLLKNQHAKFQLGLDTRMPLKRVSLLFGITWINRITVFFFAICVNLFILDHPLACSPLYLVSLYFFNVFLSHQIDIFWSAHVESYSARRKNRFKRLLLNSYRFVDVSHIFIVCLFVLPKLHI